MDIYTNFSEVYDLFMRDVPYEQWVDYILEILNKQEVATNDIVDLGCGTGNISIPLAKRGYNVIGIDNSLDMLSIASQKTYEQGISIMYLNQDMRRCNVIERTDCVISICDSINYLLEDNDISDTFSCVNKSLNNNGIFIFDVNTIYKYKEILAYNTFSECLDDSCYIWENEYYEDEYINTYYLNIFIKEKNNLYSRHEEVHNQRGYDIDFLVQKLKENGFEVQNIYDAFSFEKYNEKSERVYFVAKKMREI